MTVGAKNSKVNNSNSAREPLRGASWLDAGSTSRAGPLGGPPRRRPRLENRRTASASARNRRPARGRPGETSDRPRVETSNTWSWPAAGGGLKHCFFSTRAGPSTYKARGHCYGRSCFGTTYTKIGTIQRRLAWPLRKDDTQIREAFHILPRRRRAGPLQRRDLLGHLLEPRGGAGRPRHARPTLKTYNLTTAGTSALEPRGGERRPAERKTVKDQTSSNREEGPAVHGTRGRRSKLTT